MSTLDRLRDIVKPRSAVPVVATDTLAPGHDGQFVVPSGRAPAVALGTADYARAALTLGGALVERNDGAVIVVDREYREDMRHGQTRIGDIVDTIQDGLDAMRLMARAWPAAHGIGGRILFLDLETTGLFTGAGTQAFLVGCAIIDGSSIRLRQFLMPGFEHEKAVLGELQAFARDCGASKVRPL